MILCRTRHAQTQSKLTECHLFGQIRSGESTQLLGHAIKSIPLGPVQSSLFTLLWNGRERNACPQHCSVPVQWENCQKGFVGIGHCLLAVASLVACQALDHVIHRGFEIEISRRSLARARLNVLLLQKYLAITLFFALLCFISRYGESKDLFFASFPPDNSLAKKRRRAKTSSSLRPLIILYNSQTEACKPLSGKNEAKKSKEECDCEIFMPFCKTEHST
jgi:hypothetical protein